eukprot:COSAG06_NODE_4568_length_4139_cov_4.700990_7_plen_93_part_00
MKVSLPPSSASPSGFASFFFAPFLLLFFGIAAAPAAAAATPQAGAVSPATAVLASSAAWISSVISAPRSGAGAKAFIISCQKPSKSIFPGLL